MITEKLIIQPIQRLKGGHSPFQRQVAPRALASFASIIQVADAALLFFGGIKNQFKNLYSTYASRPLNAEERPIKDYTQSLRMLKSALTASVRGVINPSNLLPKPETQKPERLHLRDHFHIYVINLEQDTEKKKAITNHIQECGISPDDIQFIKGTDGRKVEDVAKALAELSGKPQEEFSETAANLHLRMDGDHIDEHGILRKGERLWKGQMGCYLSHFRAIHDAYVKHQAAQALICEAESILCCTCVDHSDALQKLEEGRRQLKEYSAVLVLEDDNRFGFKKSSTIITRNGFNAIFDQAMKELPQDWDMLYLQAWNFKRNRKGKITHTALAQNIKGNRNIKRLDAGIMLNAYAVNARMYPVILNHLGKILTDNATHQKDVVPVDWEIAKLHEKHQCFVVRDPLAYQEGESTIKGNKKKTIVQCYA